MNQDYYIGLDIGTNSVGWAVTDTRYNLVKAPVKGKYKNHDMWGIRLFDSGKTAAERRLQRSNRRRRQRQVQRIKLLQELFAEEMDKIDPTFFIRLNESRLYPEDKSESIKGEKHPLFKDEPYAESKYYMNYPTIYHLRKELIENKEPHDIRLVYLALHHIIKNRGHFLREGSFADAVDYSEPLNNLIASLGDLGIEIRLKDREIFKNILASITLSNNSKKSKLMEQMEIRLLNLEEEFVSPKEITKRSKEVVSEIIKLLIGNQGDISKIFKTVPKEINGTAVKVKLSEEKYEIELRPMMETQYPDEIACLDHIKELYDWTILKEILPDGTRYISDAKVKSYEKHRCNLELLKAKIFKEYFSDDVYRSFFKKAELPKEKPAKYTKEEWSLIQQANRANYVKYIGFLEKDGKKVRVNKCSENDFYTELKKILDIVKDTAEKNGDSVFNNVYSEVEKHTLLPLQRSKDNGVIPKQVNEFELDAILNNAAEYLPFLNRIDEEATSIKDKSVKGKIKAIFNYRIPYYVGPLSTRHKKDTAGRVTGANVWIIRREGRENDRIYPWNFNEVVDKEKCNEVFIRRMTNKCTYLIGEDVLPKNSLLYKKYLVLNEINNLKVYGEKIPVSLKQDIFNDLFKKKTKVSNKVLLDYLKRAMNDIDLRMTDISGFDTEKGFANNLSSYLDFRKKIFNDKELTFEQTNAAETIIKWITIYGNDSQMIEKMIKNHFGNMFDKNQINQIKRMRYSDWAHFSEKFLTDVRGMEGDELGNSWSIIEGLWNTNENLMQLLSNKYHFIEEIDKINSQDDFNPEDKTYENLIGELNTSPANKRAIWQTIQIVEEIQKIMKHPAKKIFVEMARGEDKSKSKTTSRKQKLKSLYENCEQDVREWALEDIESRDEREFSSKKLFLYYLQQGKCAYTKNPINLGELMSGSTRWDIDHIYPQSKIKDDSLDNMVLVEREKNAKKSNGLISREIQKAMGSTWRDWYSKGFITKEKLDRLQRRDDFSNDELAGFIARQLVETRQSSKIAADVMKQIYANNDTRIVYVKAGLVSEFRKYPLAVFKSRRVNDYHHAKDAYLNIVVGNVYNTKFTDNPWRWVKENRDKIDTGKISFNKTMLFDVADSNGEIVWIGCDQFQGEDSRCHFVEQEDPEIKGRKIVVGGDLDRIRQILRQDNCMYTELTYCDKGELFNVFQKRKGSKSATVPLKGNLPIEKYGGYTSAKTSYFAMVEIEEKKGNRVKKLIGVPVYVSNMLEHNPNALTEYCENKGMQNIRILYPMIKKNSLLIVNEFPMRIRSAMKDNIGFKNNLQLKVNPIMQECIRKIEKVLEKNVGEVDKLHDQIDRDELLELFNTLVCKMRDGVYVNRPSNPAQKLDKTREAFNNLSLRDQCSVLNEILSLFRCDLSVSADLSSLGLSKNTGVTNVNRNTVSSNSLQLVNQSITGLFENRVKLS